MTPSLSLSKVLMVMALVAASCTVGGSENATTSDDGQSSTTAENIAGENGAEATFGAEITEPNPSDTRLPISDEIRTGVLDNGLTYYALSNDSPGQSVSLRLAIKAGGFHEDPKGTGIAHFLEHMMFNGTTKYPGNQVDAVLRSIGAQIGPDFNAYTSATETVYQIAVEDAGENVETALDVLAQWASQATIDPVEVAAEAPIVREELRLSQTGGGAVQKQFEEIYYRDTPFEGTDVNGTEATIDAITAEDLRAYYDTWYRPDNMAVVIVGDRPAKDLEELIKTNFESMTARGQSVDPAYPAVELRTEPLTDVVVVDSIGDSSSSIDIPIPTWDLGTEGGQRLWTTEVLLGIMIDTRIGEGVQSGRLDLQRGGANWFTFGRGLSYMGFNVAAEDLIAATETALTEINGSAVDGFSQAELDRATDQWRSFLDQRLQGENDITDDEWADSILEDFLGGADLQSVEDSVEMGLELVSSLTVEEVNNHWRWILASAEPLVVTIGPDAETVGEPSDLLGAIERSRDAGSTQLSDDIAEIDQLMDRPNEVKEVSKKVLRDSGATELQFENGMSVLFLESDIHENQVILGSVSPGGRSQLTEIDGALAGAAVETVTSSGVGDFSTIQVTRYLSDLDVALSPYVGDLDEGFSGGSATDDIEVLFQLLHLSVTAPAVDDVTLAQTVKRYRDQATEISRSSSSSADQAFSNAITGGANLSFSPTEEQLQELSADKALEIHNDRFQSLDDHLLMVVGDVSEDTVVGLARSYIGSLPTPNEDPTPTPLDLPGEVSIETNAGSGEAGGAYRFASWGNGPETIKNRVLAEVATSYLTDRVFTDIREKLGSTYGGQAAVVFDEPGDTARLVILIDGDPDRIDEISQEVDAILSSISNGQIANADFDEAITVIRSRYNFIDNGFYLQTMLNEYDISGTEVISRSAQQAALDQVTPTTLSVFIDSLINQGNSVVVKNVPS